MRQKGFAPIVILLVIIILGLLGYIVYLKGFIRFNIPQTSPTLSPKSVLSPQPTSIPSDNIKNWKKGFISITLESERLGNRIYRLEFKYPPDWSYIYQLAETAQVKTHWSECDKKVITFTSPNKNVLTIAPICGSWAADYESISIVPGYSIVDTKYKQGNDSHTTYIIRYTPNQGLRFDYFSVDTDNKITSDSKIFRAVLVSYAEDDWFFIPAIPFLDVTKIGTNDISTADEIVKSLNLSR